MMNLLHVGTNLLHKSKMKCLSRTTFVYIFGENACISVDFTSCSFRTACYLRKKSVGFASFAFNLLSNYAR